jgi:outer membrane lipoprotein-sorting protein
MNIGNWIRRFGQGAAFVAGVLVVVASAVHPVTGEESGSDEASEQASSQPDESTPTFTEVMSRFDELYRSDASHAKMTMKVDKESNSRELTLEMWTKGEEHALVVIRKPEREAGTATLRKPDGLWNYAPRADRLIRVPSGLLSDSWMGSHFTNDDLMRETSWDDDYNGSVEAVTREGAEQLKVTMTPKPDAPVVYTEVIGYFSKDPWVPQLFEYYDGDELVRTMTFDDVRDLSGRKVPMEMTLRPGSQETGEYTRMTYEVLEFDVEISDRKFSRQGLRREAQR